MTQTDVHVATTFMGQRNSKEFTCDCEEATVTNTYKQELEAETVLCFLTSKGTTRHWILAYVYVQSLLSTIVVYSFCASLCWAVFYFWKALLRVAVGILGSSQVHTLVILGHALEADPMKKLSITVIPCWSHEKIVNHGDFLLVGNLTRTPKCY